MEAYVTYIILHEIGHTLGLQHNFKGSLHPPSSSAMDYLTVDDARRMTVPGAYDRDALAYLYGLRANAALPSQPFCDDVQATRDPECASFDTSDDPLAKDAGPKYQAELTAYLTAKSDELPNGTLNKVAKWLRAHPSNDAQARTRLQAQKLQAWEYLVAALRPGATAGATPERIDAAWQHVLNRLYVDPPELRNEQVFATHDPPSDDRLSPKIAQDATDLLGGAHAIAVRRVAAIVLKRLSQ